MRTILQKLQISSNIPIILYNGSIVIYNKSLVIIHRRTIKSDAVRSVLSVSERFSTRTYAYLFNQLNGSNFRMVHDVEQVLGWSKWGKPAVEFNGLPINWQNSYGVVDDIEPSAILIEAI